MYIYIIYIHGEVVQNYGSKKKLPKRLINIIMKLSTNRVVRKNTSPSSPLPLARAPCRAFRRLPFGDVGLALNPPNKNRKMVILERVPGIKL